MKAHSTPRLCATLVAAMLTPGLLTSCDSTTAAPSGEVNKPYRPYEQIGGSYLRGPRHRGGGHR